MLRTGFSKSGNFKIKPVIILVLFFLKGIDFMAPKRFNRQTIFTVIAMINIIWYTLAVLILNFFGHTVQSDITVAWFSAWTVELGLLFGIKVLK